MYLWKYWRESRVAVIASLVVIFIVLLLTSKMHGDFIVNGRPLSLPQLSIILPVLLFIQAFPVGFLAWIFGSFGVGRDLGERSGSFLFTRPASRAFFIWSDWGYGMAELLALVTVLNLVLGFMLHRLLLATGDPLHGKVLIADQPVALAAIVVLNIATTFLLAGLIFSVTYFSTIVARSAKGVMLAAGLLLGYVVLGVVVHHYWPGFNLPPIIPTVFAPVAASTPGFVDHLGLSLALRLAVILLFPFAAQLVLQKADI
jgi:hypothetical protein